MAPETSTQPSTGKVLSPAKLAHVVLRTAQYTPMVAFYKAFLGAHASYENDMLAFLTYDDEHHRVAIARIPGTTPKARGSSGLEHIAFTFPTLADLLLAYTQRKVLGIKPLWCVNHGPTMSIYYQDPDGNQIETQTDVFDSIEESNAAMMSEEFAENPLGVDFDPEALIRSLEGGADEATLMKRGRIGPRSFDSVPLLNPPEPDVRESYDVVA